MTSAPKRVDGSKFISDPGAGAMNSAVVNSSSVDASCAATNDDDDAMIESNASAAARAVYRRRVSIGGKRQRGKYWR